MALKNIELDISITESKLAFNVGFSDFWTQFYTDRLEMLNNKRMELINGNN